MLLEYYGIEYEYKKLRKEIGVLRWGTSAPQLGSWLLKHGFDVEIVTMHPALFNLSGSNSPRLCRVPSVSVRMVA
jgi:ABC-type bacteriocin/lantibiotic exporter with double-glycine peptidase domain